MCFFPGLFSSQVMEKNRNFNVKFIPREKLKPNFVGVFFNLFDFFINLFSLATVLNVNTIELLATSNLGFYVVFLHRLTCDVERRRVSKIFPFSQFSLIFIGSKLFLFPHYRQQFHSYKISTRYKCQSKSIY